MPKHVMTLNYEEAVNSIYIDEEMAFSLDIDQCDCITFCDPHNKHILHSIVFTVNSFLQSL